MKAYNYSRVSSLKQTTGQGLERQADMTAAWLSRHPEIALDTQFTFKDAGKSAFKGKHIEKGASLALFLNAVESGLIQTPCYLLLEQLDRITRLPPIEARDKVIHPLLNKGVTIVTVSDGREYSSQSVNDMSTGASLMLELFLGMAYQYSKNLSNRVQAAKKKQREQAGESRKVFTAMCPFWLRVVENTNGDKSFEEIPEAVEIVKRVFSERVNDQKSLFKIAAGLNADGIPLYTHIHSRKGKLEWTSASLGTLLKNESVIGILRESQHLDERGNSKYPAISGYYPQVIDSVTWDKAQLLSRQGKPPSKREFAAATNIFRGYIRCKHCGKLTTINGVRPDFSGSITCRSSRDGLCFHDGIKTPTYSMKKFEIAVLGCLFANMSKMEINNGVSENIASLSRTVQ
ncbi:recombinase family protein [Escherichia coli]|uniref:recombinase family protein n=1 Tax=Escherichia coli TaxID=562 RepID=UPI0037DBFB24